MKTPEPDNRVVDYVYDDLSDAERAAFIKGLEENEREASDVASVQTLLKLYREEAEELTPSVAATEKLLAAAQRSTQSWWSRVFGNVLPQLVLRPAVGVAVMAVLVIGVGVFFFLSHSPESTNRLDEKGTPSVMSSSSPAETSAAETAEARNLVSKDTADKTVTRTGSLAGEGSPADTVVAGLDQKKAESKDKLAPAKPQLSFEADGKAGLRGKNFRDAERGDDKPRSVASKRRASRRAGALRELKEKRGLAVFGDGRMTANAPGPTRLPPVQASSGTRRKTSGAAGSAQAVPKPSAKPTLTPPALYNLAQTSLAKGRVAHACALFGSLVRQHRGYPRRADALLGWARCELARGAYDRAEALVRQLVKEHPSWRKAGHYWLAQIRNQRTVAARRAQKRAYRQQAKPARRRARRRPRSRPTSTQRH